jgi:hypothetical protein
MGAVFLTIGKWAVIICGMALPYQFKAGMAPR